MNLLEIKSTSEVMETSVQNENIVKSKTRMDSSSMLSEDVSIMKHKCIRHQLGNHQVAELHQHKTEKTMKHLFSTSLDDQKQSRSSHPPIPPLPNQAHYNSRTDGAQNAVGKKP